MHTPRGLCGSRWGAPLWEEDSSKGRAAPGLPCPALVHFPSAVLPVGGPVLLGVRLDVRICWEAGRTGNLSEPTARPVLRLSVIFGISGGRQGQDGEPRDWHNKVCGVTAGRGGTDQPIPEGSLGCCGKEATPR